MTTKSIWLPYSEPLRSTLVRTFAIAFAIGGALTLRSGQWSNWPLNSLLVLWFSFGGHFAELWFLNWLRFRISSSRPVQVVARVLTWFIDGCVLMLGMSLTASVLTASQQPLWRNWWLGGLMFIGAEVVVHLVLWLRRLPCFYDGRG